MRTATEFLLGRKAAPPAHADYWYRDAPGDLTSQAGLRVTAETSLMLSTVYRCVTLIAGTEAMLPFPIFERTGPRSRERADFHPLAGMLSGGAAKPNKWQTAQEFREMLTGHLLLRGNGYAEIVPGERGPVDQLIPLHPSRVKPKMFEDGSVAYDVRPDPNVKNQRGGGTRVLLDDEMLHLRSWAHNGLEGMSPITAAREGIGLGLATEMHGARFFGKGARPGGLLKSEKKITDPVAKSMAARWKAAHQGPFNTEEIAVLGEGLEYQNVGLSNKDSQFLEVRRFQVADVGGRIFGVPLFLLFETEKSTSWGTGLSQQSTAFLVYTLMLWLSRWESGVNSRLILNPTRFFAEHVVDALLRADPETRNKAFALGLQWGWLSINEVRAFSNMNPIPGGDVHLVPTTHQTLERAIDPPDPVAPGAAAPAPAPRPGSDRDGGVVAYLFAEAHGRVLRAECRTLRAKLSSCEPATWPETIAAFYRKHREFAAQAFEPALRSRELLLGENGLSSDDLAGTVSDLAQRALVEADDPLALIDTWQERGRLSDMLLLEPVERGDT